MNLADKFKKYILNDRLTNRIYDPKIKLVNIKKEYEKDMLLYSNAVQVFDEGRLLLPCIYFNYERPRSINAHMAWYEPLNGFVFMSSKLSEKYNIPRASVVYDSGILRKIEKELIYSD